MANDYWAERQAETQARLTERNIQETEKQIIKYYQRANRKIIGQFQETYIKILSSIEDDREPTPADLYKLDVYWQMQAQTQAELQKLGDYQLKTYSEYFVKQYQQIYEATAIPTNLTYGKIDKQAIEQMINQIWCADGKSWSSRVWRNVSALQESLNNGLLDCLLTGQSPAFLKQVLMESFNVSFSNADMIVRTEMAHIQTQASQKRYQDAGIEWVEVLADKDERRCDICGKLHRKRFPVNGVMPVPAHPRCRCCIIPVVDDLNEQMKFDGF